MDFAYDHITERSFSNDRSNTATPKPGDGDSTNNSTTPTDSQAPQRTNLQTEFQETFKAFSNSPWGAKLGGWWSTAQKQAASTYEVARKEAERREAEAAKALEGARQVLVERTKTVVEGVEEGLDSIVNEDRREKEQEANRLKEQERVQNGDAKEVQQAEGEDTETFLVRFKSEAAKRLKEVQKAEDAADEALLRFGMNIRNFLKDTISITAPEASSSSNSSEVLFESRDAAGRRIIHTSRFDAQLHVIHTTPSSFTQDPDASQGEWEKFKENFDIEKETDSIAKDLDKYPELRTAMEKLMSENVEYKDFWTRYYFMRHVVEVREEKRREMLKASAADQEEVGWDEDSDSEEHEKDTSKSSQKQSAAPIPSHARNDSDAMTLRPARRSHDEKSVADSEASYDLVSGAASHANSSPKEKPIKEEESDDDWE